MAAGQISNPVTSTLLVTSLMDPASVVMKESLLSRGGWTEMHRNEKSQSWSHCKSNIWMLCIEGSMIRADNVDSYFSSLHNIDALNEVIFLSRHSAVSGQPSLTVHPIGIPNLKTENTAGGVVGKFPPPNPRLSQCLRILSSHVGRKNMTSEFSVTFEATHHGPFLNTPSMFCEIGSTEEHWGRKDAAELWADVIASMLNLDSCVEVNPDSIHWRSLSNEQIESSTVCINLGGGHYAPKPGDLARKGVHMGHMLANYAFDWSEDEGWRDTLMEAVASTQLGFPGAKIKALIDKKAFKADQRKALELLLASLGIEFFYKKEQLVA